MMFRRKRTVHDIKNKTKQTNKQTNKQQTRKAAVRFKTHTKTLWTIKLLILINSYSFWCIFHDDLWSHKCKRKTCSVNIELSVMWALLLNVYKLVGTQKSSIAVRECCKLLNVNVLKTWHLCQHYTLMSALHLMSETRVLQRIDIKINNVSILMISKYM